MRKGAWARKTNVIAIPAQAIRAIMGLALCGRAYRIQVRRSRTPSGKTILLIQSGPIEILGEAAIHAKSTNNNAAAANHSQTPGKIALATSADRDHARLIVFPDAAKSLGLIGATTWFFEVKGVGGAQH